MPTIQTPPLRLKPAERDVAPSMWILRGPDAEKRLKDFVSHADQRLVQDIDAAVAEGADGKPMVILKANRNARGKALELNIPGAMPLAPHSPVNPNLFIPANRQLNVPRIRPEKLRELFAQNPNHVAWLTPDEEEEGINQQIPEYVAGEGGRSPTRFNTESIGQEHFQPLDKLVNYTKPKQQPLKPWTPGESPFTLEPFEDKPSTEPIQSAPDDKAVRRWEQENLHARPLGYLAQRLNQLLGRGWSFHYPDPRNNDYERRFVPPATASPRAIEAAQPLFNELMQRQTYGGPVPDAGSGRPVTPHPQGEMRAPAAPLSPPEPVVPTPQVRPRPPRRPKAAPPPPQMAPEPLPPPEAAYAPPALTNAEAIARKEALEKQIIAEAQKEGEGQNDKAHTDPHLWSQLAEASKAAGLPDTASHAWQTALWEHEGDPRLIQGWANTEGVRDPIRDIDSLLRQHHPSTQEAHKMAAAILLAKQAAPQQLERLRSRLYPWLEANQGGLGSKAAWLASKAVAGEDVAFKARMRDRLLEQLHSKPMETRHQDAPDLLKHLGGGQVLHHYLEAVHDATQHWLEGAAKSEPRPSRAADGQHGPIASSRGLAELISAIQMAKIGSQSRAQELRRLAEPLINRNNPVQAWLANALSHRLDQALQGQSIETPLPDSVGLHRDPSQQFVTDTYRNSLSSLVPGRNVNKFRSFVQGVGPIKAMSGMTEEELRPAMQHFMANELGGIPASDRVRAIAEVAPHLQRLSLGESHRHLEQMTSSLLGHKVGKDDAEQYAKAINHLMPALVQHNMVDSARELTGRLGDAIESADPKIAIEMSRYGLPGMSRHLRRLGLANSAGLLASRVASRIQQRPAKESDSERLKRLDALSQIAAEHLANGNREAAQPILAESADALAMPTDKTSFHASLAKSYLDALQQLPDRAEASARVVDLLGKLPAIKADQAASKPGVGSVHHLAIAERAHKAVAGEGSSRSPEARGWMDDDEYITRRKIHGDTNQAIREAGL